MYKKGDYVVDKNSQPLGLKPSLMRVVEPNEAVCWCTNISNFELNLYLPTCSLRPAVLSDWAVEIPEEHKEYRYVYLIRNEKGNVCICYSGCEKSLIIWGCPMSGWVAKAISAHYGIPIMPHGLYKKYMEAK